MKVDIELDLKSWTFASKVIDNIGAFSSFVDVISCFRNCNCVHLFVIMIFCSPAVAGKWSYVFINRIGE